MAENGHWYTDKNGNHYFVKEGETPKEGWERSKRRKMLSGGKYTVDDGDGRGSREVSKEEYDKYEADQGDFDLTNDDDFGFDESEDNAAEDPNQYFDEVFAEMRKNGIDIGDKKEVLRELVANYRMDRDDQKEFMKYMYGENYDQRFGKEDDFDPTNEENSGGKSREELAAEEINAAQPKEPGLHGRWPNEIITDKNKESFLYENGLADKFYWDGPDLVDKKTGETVASLGKAGTQAKSLYNSLGLGDADPDENHQGEEGVNQLKYEAEDIGNMRTFPNKSGSNMDGNNRWIGERHSVYDAYGADEKNFDKLFKYIGNSKDGANIFQGPDKYYSLNPRINGESFKSIEDLEDYYANEGNYGNPRYRDESGMMADNRKLRYEDYKKRKGLDGSQPNLLKPAFLGPNGAPPKEWFEETFGEELSDDDYAEIEAAFKKIRNNRKAGNKKPGSPGGVGGRFRKESPDDKEKEPHLIGPDGHRYDSEADYNSSMKEREKAMKKAEEDIDGYFSLTLKPKERELQSLIDEYDLDENTARRIFKKHGVPDNTLKYLKYRG